MSAFYVKASAQSGEKRRFSSCLAFWNKKIIPTFTGMISAQL